MLVDAVALSRMGGPVSETDTFATLISVVVVGFVVVVESSIELTISMSDGAFEAAMTSSRLIDSSSTDSVV